MLRDYDRKVTELISVDDFDSAELGAEAVPADETRATVSDFRSSGQVA